MNAKRNRPIYKQIQFDSPDEVEFYAWCQQLKQQGIISEFVYQPESFLLSQPVKFSNKNLLREHVYTPDFFIFFKQKLQKDSKLFQIFKYPSQNNKYYVEIKPGFDRFNDFKAFIINQKWVYSKYGIYIYKIEVQKLFNNTFVPQHFRYTQKTKKIRAKYKDAPNIKQYLYHL